MDLDSDHCGLGNTSQSEELPRLTRIHNEHYKITTRLKELQIAIVLFIFILNPLYRLRQ